MGFGVSKEALEGFKPVPNGLYDVQLVGFSPKKSKNGDSINLNPDMKIVNHPEFAGQKIFFNLNTKGGFIFPDIAHCFGLPMEMHPTGENGAEEGHLPGGPNAWVADPSAPDDISKTKYVGPLLGKVGKIDVIIEVQPGQKPRNAIKAFICAIPDCATKFPDVSHSTSLVK